jgi:histidinol-phosphatase
MEEFKRVAIKAVEKAANRIMYHFNKGFEVMTKEDLTPVTLADKEGEEIIVSEIKKSFPDHAFEGEEYGIQGKGDYVWVIDPIDGTKSFIHRLPFWSTLLTLFYKGVPIVAVSNAPVLNEMMVATKEERTTLNGKEARVSEINNLEKAFVVFGGLRKESQLLILKSLVKKVQGMRGYGDFYGYHLVASGRAEIMLESYAKKWDLAAPKLLVEQAGGAFSDYNGDRDVIGTTALATNGKVHEEVLKIIKEVIG